MCSRLHITFAKLHLKKRCPAIFPNLPAHRAISLNLHPTLHQINSQGLTIMGHAPKEMLDFIRAC
jgi:hypothetical protein